MRFFSPRQALAATPYAVYAGSAGAAATASTVPASGISSGTAGISISGNAATATTAATALTAGTATNLAGILPDAHLSANIARLNGTNLHSGTNIFSNTLIATNPANQISGTFTGNGAALTNLSSISIAPGSITAGMLAPGAVSVLGSPDGSPTNAVVVDNNGLVGIGVTNPAAWRGQS